MPEDYYALSGRRWAEGAELVYRPIAAELVAASPHPLTGRTVLDAGAGTGAATAALRQRRARVVAMDLSHAMLAWRARDRPPSAVADIRALPLPADAVDDCVAAFVLNHLTDPAAGLAELARVTRPGGAVLAAVFGTEGHSDARDRIDQAALGAGCRVPAWYRQLKATTVPILGTAPAMAAAARSAGLTGVRAGERQIDVGITEPAQLVRYRLGHPIYAAWLDDIGPDRAARFATEAARSIPAPMPPYRPHVVLLRAQAP